MSSKSSSLPVSFKDIRSAQKRLAPHLPVTPLTRSLQLSEILGREIFFKWDNSFPTGSFKERGACNKVSLLSKAERSQGVCAASAGNHALALSRHCVRESIQCTIVMPQGAPLVKIQATRDNGSTVVLRGHTFQDAYAEALALAQKKNLTFVPGFDDPHIIAGQGTSALEIVEQCSDFDSIVVPIGGGGLIAGIALALRHLKKRVHIIGVQSEWAVRRAQGKLTVNRAHPALTPATIADGIALTLGTITKPFIDTFVDTMVQVSESQIAAAIMAFLEFEHKVIEGAGAAGLAAVLAGKLPKKCKRTVILACGSNIDMNILSRLIERNMGERGRLLKITISVPDRPGALHAATGLLAQSGANILEALHDRSFSVIPGNVDITFVLEVKNVGHRAKILRTLGEAGVKVIQEI